MSTLRPYQRQNRNEILSWLSRGHSPLYHLPTGGGKSRVATDVIGTVCGQAGWPAAFYVHRRELVKQASAALCQAGIDHGVIEPGCGVTSHRVHVAAIDTVGRRLTDGDAEIEGWINSLRLMVPDESHHAIASSWSRVLDASPDALYLGLSATPFRLDGRGLGDRFDAIVRGPSIAALIADGWLSPFRVKAPPLTVDRKGLPKRGGDYSREAVEQLLDTEEVTRKAIAWYSRLAPGRPAATFCAGVDHAHHVAAAFDAAGWRAVAIDGGTAEGVRDPAVAGLATGNVQNLVSVDLISEGFNCPDLVVGIWLRLSQSTMLIMQQIGRLLRPVYAKGMPLDTAEQRRAAIAAGPKPCAWIIDLVGNIGDHGLPDLERPWTLEGGVKRLERAVTGTRRCPYCYEVHHIADARCPDCGYRYPKQPARGHGGAIWHMPGVGRLSAEDVLRGSMDEILENAANEDDLRRVADIRDFPRKWVTQMAQSSVWRERRAGR